LSEQLLSDHTQTHTHTVDRCCIWTTNVVDNKLTRRHLACAPMASNAGWLGADVPHCWHSTRLRAWSSFCPLDIQQDTCCSTDTQQLWQQKLCRCGATPSEQFTY